LRSITRRTTDDEPGQAQRRGPRLCRVRYLWLATCGGQVELHDTIQQLRNELQRISRAIALLESLAPSADVSRPAVPPARKRGRTGMNAEERQQVSERMRRYWAERRQQRGASEQSESEE